MRVLVLAVCFLLLNEIDCWARRRRLPEEGRKKRDESAVVELEREERDVVSVSLEQCEEDVFACGFTIKCHCCSSPSFNSCGATGLIGSPAIKLLRKRRRSASDNETDKDEAGCSLRAVEYNGQALCLPGNVASMMAIVQQSTSGDCYPVYPLNCQEMLQDNIIYFQYFYVPATVVETTLEALELAGHHCKISEHESQGGVKCAI